MIDIFGTFGPACAKASVMEDMFRQGMTGMRLNLSHVTLQESAEQIDAFREAARLAGVSPKLLIDLQGPELRIGALPQPLRLREGDRVRLGGDIPVPAQVRSALRPGQDALLDDGKLLLRQEPDGRALVLRGGVLQSRKSIALPGCEVRLPALTDRDLENLSHASAFGVTGVMQPFVRSREDLTALRAALQEAGCGHVRVYAKIENCEGMACLPELLSAADEIVIARGDLGNAMPLWELPAAQKTIAAACRASGVPFMVVTQMLASMEHSPVPTRAEMSDIFNAVLDGAASVMVTGETAAGSYPVESVRYLSAAVHAAEQYLQGK